MAELRQLRHDDLEAVLEVYHDAVISQAPGRYSTAQIRAWAGHATRDPQVRLALQRGFRQLPGLVADGRDMGTVIFPDAALKVFLTASARCRAGRRHKQLISKGISATLAAIEQDLEARDLRDSSRQSAPLKPAQDAKPLDNSELTIEQSIAVLIDWWRGNRPL